MLCRRFVEEWFGQKKNAEISELNEKIEELNELLRIAQEEIFRPVISVLRVGSFEEGVEAANSVKYGLSASVFTRDVSRAYRFTDLIDVGIVHVNSGTPGGEAQLPFGGNKATGVGPREQGPNALDFFTEVKTVYVDYTGSARKGSLY